MADFPLHSYILQLQFVNSLTYPFIHLYHFWVEPLPKAILREFTLQEIKDTKE